MTFTSLSNLRKPGLFIRLFATFFIVLMVLCVLRYPSKLWATNQALNTAASKALDAKQQAHLIRSYGQLPLLFEPNVGQTDPQVRFLARGAGYSIYLTPAEAVLTFQNRVKKSNRKLLTSKSKLLNVSPEVIRMRLVGGDRLCQMVGEDELLSNSNYLVGNDSGKWHFGIKHTAEVKMREVYPCIDMVYYGNQGKLEYDFIVRPGANLKDVRLKFEGATRIQVNARGDVVLKTKNKKLAFQTPLVYQKINGEKKKIKGRFIKVSKDEVGFEVEGYDATQLLVIDPTLVYSTYVGGGNFGTNNELADMKIDAGGNVYLLEGLWSGFPTTSGVYQSSSNGYSDCLILKLNTTGTSVIYATYIGGSKYDYPSRIAVDVSGNVYVTGKTNSPDYPTTSGVFQTTYASGFNYTCFVTKLNATGTGLIYSTYLGGTTEDEANSIALDSSGNAYVTGRTYSSDFPITGGAFQTVLGGGSFNAFVAKLNTSGTGLNYSTFLGGNGNDVGHDIAVDVSGNAYVTGFALSSNFPTTAGVYQPTYGGGGDAFVTKVNSTGTGLIYSTYLGGSTSSGDTGNRITLDSSGNAYVLGSTGSNDFPTTSGAYQTVLNGFGDLFVTKLNPTGTGLIYSTYLGGNSFEYPWSIIVDSNQSVYVSGSTLSSDFPTTAGALQASGTSNSAIFSILNSTGSALLYSTCWGGTGGSDDGAVVALDSSGAIYLAGSTYSADFVTTAGAYQSTLSAAGEDMWVTKLVFPTATPTITYTPTPTPLLHVWPNPFDFNSGTGYFYAGYVDAKTSLNIYTVSGEPVITDLKSTTGTIVWDGRNKNNAKVSSGLYVYVIRENDKTLLAGKFIVVNGK